MPRREGFVLPPDTDEAHLPTREREVCDAEVFREQRTDQARSREPPLISFTLVLNHCGEGVDLARDSPERREGGGVYNLQERREPRLDGDKPPAVSEYAARFGKYPHEVVFEIEQVVETALDDKNILRRIRPRQEAAIADLYLTPPLIKSDQAQRKINAFDISKFELGESVKTVAPPAEEFADARRAGPHLRP